MRSWPAVEPSDGTGVGARVGATDGATAHDRASTGVAARSRRSRRGHRGRRPGARTRRSRRGARRSGRRRHGRRTESLGVDASANATLRSRTSPPTPETGHDRGGRASARRGRSADGDARSVPHPDGADGSPAIYLAGQSLGLQPRTAAAAIATELDAWARLGVDAWFDPRPSGSPGRASSRSRRFRLRGHGLPRRCGIVASQSTTRASARLGRPFGSSLSPLSRRSRRMDPHASLRPRIVAWQSTPFRRQPKRARSRGRISSP